MTNAPPASSPSAFQRYIDDCRPLMRKQYERLLVGDLSRQQAQGCFQRNVLLVLAQTYQQALAQLPILDLEAAHPQQNCSKQILACCQSLGHEFVRSVVDRHRTSCALSNFPAEHKPDTAYVDTVMREAAGLWQRFAQDVEHYFQTLAKENP